jgi:murein DD-endopeptidase MepM/ murein hydrolase activator NlpD
MEYRRYALHGLLVLLALLAVAVAAARGLGPVSGPLVFSAAQPPISDDGAGYMKSPVVLSTGPGLVAGLLMEEEMTAMLELVPEATPQATLEPTPETTPAPTPEPTPPFFDYTIKPGDTIIGIANSFGIDPDYVLWNNPLVSQDPNLLEVGEVLVVPSIDAIIYRIKLSDTITDVAAHYDIDLESVVSANSLSSPDIIGENAVLLLPGAVPPAPAPAPVVAAEPPPVPQPAPASATSASGYIWPWYDVVTSYYDEWRGGGVHGALDINGAGSYGASVVAAASGQVVLAAYENYGYGYHVVIRDDDGSQALYAHFSDIYVVQGQWVGQGEAIGALGCTGYCTGTHLHFEIIIGGVKFDPLAYLP